MTEGGAAVDGRYQTEASSFCEQKEKNVVNLRSLTLIPRIVAALGTKVEKFFASFLKKEALPFTCLIRISSFIA